MFYSKFTKQFIGKYFMQKTSDTYKVKDDKNSQTQVILNDNLWKVCFKLSWPAIIAMIMLGSNSLLDFFFVGRYVGESALAGLSLAYPLVQILSGFGALLGVGAGTLLSILIGSKETQKQERLIGNLNSLVLIISVILIFLGLIFNETLIKLVGGRGDALIFGKDYFSVILYGTFFWISGMAGNMLVRSEGKMKSAAIMIGIGLIINAIANYIFIVVLDYGVKGAAWGTNIAMLVYLVLFYVYAGFGFMSFKSKIFSLRLDKDIVKSILSLGFPSMILNITGVIQGLVVFNVLSVYGTVSDIAFYGIVFRIINLLGMPVVGIMLAVQPVFGMNYGAKQYERLIEAFKVFSKAGTYIILPFWLFFMIEPTIILNLLLPTKEFSTQDIFNFRIFMLIEPLIPFVYMAMSMFTATENPKPIALLSIARQIVFYVPVMLILPAILGVSWVYIGTTLIDAIVIIWLFVLTKKLFKKLKNLDQFNLEIKN